MGQAENCDTYGFCQDFSGMKRSFDANRSSFVVVLRVPGLVRVVIGEGQLLGRGCSASLQMIDEAPAYE